MTTTATRPPTIAELKKAYAKGDRAAPETAPMLRERRFAWMVADAFGLAIAKREAVLRSRIRAERDFLQAFLIERRGTMHARVIADFKEAITALDVADDVLIGSDARGSRRSG